MPAGFPLALPNMRIGLLGGSFDPAHEGHRHITLEALRRFQLDQIWWLVSPGNPLKACPPAPLAGRMAYAKALMHHPRVKITALESRLNTRTTFDIICALKTRYPHVQFVWLMGADNLAQFHKWHRWHDIAARLPIAVLARPNWLLKAANSRFAHMHKATRQKKAPLMVQAGPYGWILQNIPLNNMSSTKLRAKAAVTNGPSFSK